MEVDNIYRPPQADMAGPPPLPAAEQAQMPFFQTPPMKMAVLSIASWGLYMLYWFHKQWYRRKAQGEDVIPILRTIFAVLFAYQLFQSVNHEIQRRQPPGLPLGGSLGEPLNAGGLALGFFVINVFYRLPGLVGLVGIFSFIPLMFVQQKINELHTEMGFDPALGSKFSVGDIVTLVIGGLFWALVLIGLVIGTR